MKIFKAVMLGSAAGLCAVGTGQAAELPVKARPVAYLKVCSLYGAGFYYMPGTDMCIRIGGWVRAEAAWGVNGNMDLGPFNSNVNNRYTNNLVVRERGYITADAREMTAYGVARGYIAVGISSNNTGGEAPSAQFSSNRAFVQWAGFTAGLTESFYDFYSGPAVSYRNGAFPSSDTEDGGTWLWAYTAQLGNGMSATLAAEARRLTQIINTGPGVPTSNGVLPSGTFAPGGGYGGWQSPDVVGNLRIEQSWGGAQVMGALHEVNPGYYGMLPVSGHAGDSWGWAVGAGVRFNTPFVSQGDWFQSQVNVTEGALRYLSFFNEGNYAKVDGSTEGYGVMSDCILGGTIAAGTATGCTLTSAWSVNASYEHYWTPQWHQSFVGSYMAVNYDSAANAQLCALAGLGAGSGSTAVATPGCNNNWSTWGVGSRLQWDVTKTFYLGVEVLYDHLNSAATPTGALPAVAALTNSGATTVASQSNWMATVRMHKDFLP
jgi:hypothetical protein